MTVSIEQCAQNAKKNIKLGKVAFEEAEARYKEAGKWLIQAQAMLGLARGHNGGKVPRRQDGLTWRKWVMDNIGVTLTTSQRYMDMARGTLKLADARELGRLKTTLRNRQRRVVELASIAAGDEPANVSPKSKIIGSICSKLWTLSIKELEDLDKEFE